MHPADDACKTIASLSTGRQKWRLAPWLVLTFAAAFWIIFLALSAPDMGGTDAFIFRDAGCSCASGLGLVSNSAPNDGASIPPKLFAAYTPGAPLLFAPAASLFGCTSRTDTFYNYFLLLALSIIALCFYFQSEEKPWRRLIAAALVGFTLPGGLFLSDLDRPEAMALIFALSLLLIWRRSSSVLVKSFLMGFSGLVFLVHPYVGIVEFLLFTFVLAWRRGERNRLAVFLSGTALTFAWVIGCALILQHLDITAISRFLGHAFGSGSGAGVILKDHASKAAHSSFLHNYERAGGKYFSSATILASTPLLALLCGFAVSLVFLLRIQLRRRDLMQLLCLFLILFIFPAAVFLTQRNYFAASNAFLLAAITMGGYSLSDRLRQTVLPVMLLVIVAIFSLPQFALHLIAARESLGSYRSAVEEAKQAKAIFTSQGISEPRILIDPTHLFVYKPYFSYLYNIGYFRPEEDSTSEFQGLVRCYTGQTAFSRAQLTWSPPLHEDDWRLIESGENVERITLFHHAIQRRNWTWDCDVYERKDAVPAPAKEPSE
jgi:hypothetical protein